jgi:hypothetical protein
MWELLKQWRARRMRARARRMVRYADYLDPAGAKRFSRIFIKEVLMGDLANAWAAIKKQSATKDEQIETLRASERQKDQRIDELVKQNAELSAALESSNGKPALDPADQAALAEMEAAALVTPAT